MAGENPQRVRNLLQNVAKLEFFEVAEPNETNETMLAINDTWSQLQKAIVPESTSDEPVETVDAESALESLVDSSQEDDLAAQLGASDSTGTSGNLDSLLQNQVAPQLRKS